MKCPVDSGAELIPHVLCDEGGHLASQRRAGELDNVTSCGGLSGKAGHSSQIMAARLRGVGLVCSTHSVFVRTRRLTLDWGGPRSHLIHTATRRRVVHANRKQAKEERCVDATECGLGYTVVLHTDATAVRRTLPSWQRPAALGIVASSWMLPG